MATAQTFKVNTISDAIWRGCLLVTKNAINSNILDPWPAVYIVYIKGLPTIHILNKRFHVYYNHRRLITYKLH